MKSLLLHLKSNKGETLVETLVALLIAIMSMSLLASALVSASDINAKAREQAKGLGTEISNAELSKDSASDGSLSVTIAGSTYTAQDGVAFSGGSSVSSYKVNSTWLRQAIAQGTEVMEANKEAWKDYGPQKVAVQYVKTVGADKVYHLSPDEVDQLFNGESFPARTSSKLEFYLLPSCTYVNGELLNFQIIQANVSATPLDAKSVLRPVAFLYNGEVYGCFDKAGSKIVYGMYIFGGGAPVWQDELNNKLHTGAWAVDQWFANAKRPDAEGNKNGNGEDGLIITGGVY